MYKLKRTVNLSSVEWQVLVPVFMSLIAWLDANTFIQVHELHSLTKCVSVSGLQEDNERDKYAVNDRLYQHPEGGCTPQERYQD